MPEENQEIILKTISYNMHGYFQGYPLLNELLNSNSNSDRPDICLLQEHWLTPDNMNKFEGDYSNYFVIGCSAMNDCLQSGMLRGRPFGGVAILVNKKLRHITKTITCDERYVIVKIGDCLFINIYLPCAGTDNRMAICENILHDMWSWRQLYLNYKCIIAGDFNANLDGSDCVSRYIRDFITDSSLHRCDKQFYGNSYPVTYINISRHCESSIDYVVASNADIVTELSVLDPDLNFSDHVPIHFSVRCALTDTKSTLGNSNRKTECNQLRWDRADLTSYYAYTGHYLQMVLPEADKLLTYVVNGASDYGEICRRIDDIYDDIVSVLLTASQNFVPVISKNFLKFWWNEELAILKEESVQTNRIWKGAGKPRHGPIFQKRQTARMKYRKGIRDTQNLAATSYTNSLHEALMNKNGTVFWKCWRSKFEHGEKCNEVGGCTDKEEVAENFSKYFSEIYSGNSQTQAENLYQEYIKSRLNYCGLPLTDELTFDTEVVGKVIANLNKGKAADINGLTCEHLLFCHPCLPVILAKLFNIMSSIQYTPRGFKYSYIVPIPKVKDHRSKSMDYDDFRGIAISPTLSKVYEYCLLEKCGKFFQTSENQFGFKKGTGCRNAVYSVRQSIERYINNGSTVNICALDLSKAFDKVNHYGLYLKLMKRNIPIQLLDIIICLCSNCYSCIKWHNVFSPTFELLFGVRQGSVLSPVLFAIYIDDIAALAMPQHGILVFLYADDIMLIALSILELEKLLHACEKELNYLDMKINFKKSCCLRTGPRYNVNCANVVSLSDCCISWVSELRYLGVNIVNSTSLKF